MHGILLIALFSFAAFYIADIPFVKSLSLSPLIIGIILGMLYANSLRNRLPETIRRPDRQYECQYIFPRHAYQWF